MKRTMTQSSTALSHTLLAAANALGEVESGRSLTDALARLRPDVRPGAQALAFYAMRHWGRASALRALLVERAPSHPVLLGLLGLSLCLLDVALQDEPHDPDAPSYTPHTLVDQSVSAAQSDRSLTPFKGLVNAVLRRFQRERAALLARLASDDAARYNHPAWWVAALRRDYPGQWEQLLEVDNAHPPLTLRVNTRRATRSQVTQAFADAGIYCADAGESGLVVLDPRPIASLPGYDLGWWSVQDAGAQLAAPLLDPKPGMRVLDACAAPGGKTAHLLELADVELTALDVDAQRLDRVGQNLARLGLMRKEVRLVVADAARPHAWWDGRGFDAVLADVPCTASGIVRRHPDIRWLRKPSDVGHTVRLQRQILDALWSVVAPGGKLLLVTCSIFPEEGEMQAKWFLSRHHEAVRLTAPGQLLPCASGPLDPAGHDGFFYALFSRPAAGQAPA
ncbi:MAG: 16S rRNA (cytosine(967)-C(5))-methyltransferase RsmB [Burkholderiaceae bacterium]|nr:16S rRNA (cytosine(967)-C(5))-methyltransferase RsmB [Burkholderiaceae bacterium]